MTIEKRSRVYRQTVEVEIIWIESPGEEIGTDWLSVITEAVWSSTPSGHVGADSASEIEELK